MLKIQRGKCLAGGKNTMSPIVQTLTKKLSLICSVSYHINKSYILTKFIISAYNSI